MIVVVETVLSIIGNVQVRPAIVIVIAHGYAEAPSLVRHARLVRDVGKRAVVIVVKQHGARSGLLPLQRTECGTVEQINVQPPVIVIVEQGHPGTRSLENRGLLRAPGTVQEFGQPCLLRDVREYHRRAVNKSSGSDRTG